MWFDSVQKGEVNRASRAEVRLAGKGINVAFMLPLLGGSARLVAFRYKYLPRPHYWAYSGCNLVWIEADAPARTCTTMIETDGTITELVEEARLPSPEEWKRMDIAVRTHVTHAGALVLSGSLMPGADPGIYAWWASAARADDVPVLIDSQGAPLLRVLAEHPRWVKITLEELERTLERTVKNNSRSIAGAAEKLCELGAGSVLVTRGVQDAVWVNSDGEHGTITPPKVEVVNPIGAGDAVSAGMLWAYQQGLSDEEMWKWGIAFGSARAAVAHAGDVEPDAVRRLFESMDA
ncbi:MAG: hypothetical protein KBA51_01260 [Kiritimatiellae bacterium]|nr:hypothetical protein [Kiritimatiellia bacterium]